MRVKATYVKYTHWYGQRSIHCPGEQLLEGFIHFLTPLMIALIVHPTFAKKVQFVKNCSQADIDQYKFLSLVSCLYCSQLGG